MGLAGRADRAGLSVGEGPRLVMARGARLLPIDRERRVIKEMPAKLDPGDSQRIVGRNSGRGKTGRQVPLEPAGVAALYFPAPRDFPTASVSPPVGPAAPFPTAKNFCPGAALPANGSPRLAKSGPQSASFGADIQPRAVCG